MKYRLLKDLPKLNKGHVFNKEGKNYVNNDTFMKHICCIQEVEDNPEWFAPMLFTTEDGVDVYLGEKCWILNTENSHVFENWVYRKDITDYPNYKYFSTKQAAEKYLEPKFKVGDFINSTRNCLSSCIRIIDITDNHYVGENGYQYSKTYARKATNEEIISYYEKLGWVKGAKIKLFVDKTSTIEHLIVDEFGLPRVKIINDTSCYDLGGCELIKYPKSWEELRNIKGGILEGFTIHGNYCSKYESLKEKMEKAKFSNFKQAESALAYAQLSQLVAEMNGDWQPDWTRLEYKYCIKRLVNQLIKESSKLTYCPLAFKSEELRDFSFEHHKELWNKYYQL